MEKYYKGKSLLFVIIFPAIYLILVIGASTSQTQAEECSVIKMTLINADSDQPIMPLENGTVINLKNLPTRNLNVKADTSPEIVDKVVFQLNDVKVFRIESGQPYALAGDQFGDFRPWTPKRIHNQITATPHLGGQQGQALTVSFDVIFPKLPYLPVQNAATKTTPPVKKAVEENKGTTPMSKPPLLKEKEEPEQTPPQSQGEETPQTTQHPDPQIPEEEVEEKKPKAGPLLTSQEADSGEAPLLEEQLLEETPEQRFIEDPESKDPLLVKREIDPARDTT